MIVFNTKFISLEALSAQTMLPKRFLRELVILGQLPHLKVGGRLRFNPMQVQITLNNLAAAGGSNEDLQ